MTAPPISAEECQRIADRLNRARTTSESSVLAIGRLLDEVVEAATEDLGEVKKNLGIESQENGNQSLKVTQSIHTQSQLVHAFVDEMRSFIIRQNEFSDAATQAFDLITECSTSVAALMQNSNILALNLWIEAGRLGKLGPTVSTIGKEMTNFSNDVRNANTIIVKALSELKSSLPSIRSELQQMDMRATQFADALKSKLEEVEERTGQLDQALRDSLVRTENKNSSILKLSLETLSELQFQDPVGQVLQKTEDEMRRLSQTLREMGMSEAEGPLSASVEHQSQPKDEQIQHSGEVLLF